VPFTLSHPAAALPIRALVRRGIVPLTPFAIGAMAPDFEYLVRLEPLALVSHSARGILVFCLPVSVVTWLLWEWLLSPVGHKLLGIAPRRRPAQDARFRSRGVVALLVGSASHVGWDAFTHRYAWGADHFPSLRDTALSVGGIDVPWYSVFQHVSTVAGGLVVLVWLSRQLATRGEGWRGILAPGRARTWTVLLAVAFAVAVWNAPRHGQMHSPRRAPIVTGRFVVGGMSGFAVALLVISILYRVGAYAFPDRATHRND